jgi:hypothetical protein
MNDDKDAVEMPGVEPLATTAPGSDRDGRALWLRGCG